MTAETPGTPATSAEAALDQGRKRDEAEQAAISTLAAHRLKGISSDTYGYRRSRCECGWAGSPWETKETSRAEHDRHVLVELALPMAAREEAAEQRGAEKALRDAFAFMDRLFQVQPVESEFSKGFAYAMSGVLEHLDERAEAAAAAATTDGGVS
jgi:hypothetical protein